MEAQGGKMAMSCGDLTMDTSIIGGGFRQPRCGQKPMHGHAHSSPVYELGFRVLIYFFWGGHFYFFQIFIFTMDDISTRMRMRVRHPYEKIAIFADTFKQTDGSTVNKNRF